MAWEDWYQAIRWSSRRLLVALEQTSIVRRHPRHSNSSWIIIHCVIYSTIQLNQPPMDHTLIDYHRDWDHVSLSVLWPQSWYVSICSFYVGLISSTNELVWTLLTHLLSSSYWVRLAPSIYGERRRLCRVSTTESYNLSVYASFRDVTLDG